MMLQMPEVEDLQFGFAHLVGGTRRSSVQRIGQNPQPVKKTFRIRTAPISIDWPVQVTVKNHTLNRTQTITPECEGVPASSWHGRPNDFLSGRLERRYRLGRSAAIDPRCLELRSYAAKHHGSARGHGGFVRCRNIDRHRLSIRNGDGQVRCRLPDRDVSNQPLTKSMRRMELLNGVRRFLLLNRPHLDSETVLLTQ